jgi:hypothetical protein
MQSKPKGKKTPAYALNKRAFDTIMLHIRRMDRPILGAVGAMDFRKVGGSTAARNPIAPLPVEFRADVLLAIKAAMPRGIRLANFILAYLLYDSDDETERNVFAQRVLGGRMHSVEQRVGAEFVRRAIFPEAVYMYPDRVNRPRLAI